LLNDVEDILGRLNEATTPQALNLPGYRCLRSGVGSWVSGR
jgi:hypothetical protein